MLMKTLPGMIIALALGLFFCLSERQNAARRESVARAGRIPASPRMPGTSVFRTGAAQGGAPAPLFSPVLDSATAEPERADLFAMAAPAPFGAPMTAVELPAVRRHDDSFGRAPVARAFGPSSWSALASLDAAIAESPAFIPTSDYPELPDKGITVWGRSESFSERQRLRDHGQSVYSQKDKIYTLGIRQDWSIDSVIGASLDIHDAEVKSRHDADFRRNNITGYVANANYHGTFQGRYPVEAKAFYGWFEHNGKGSFSRPDSQLVYPWREKKHRSTLHGFSGKAGLPLLFLENLKVLPELGVDYRRLTTKAYRAAISEDGSITTDVPEMRSTSLRIPFSVTVKKDFPQVWGIVTPRLACGAIVELDDSAGGLATWNSSSASRVEVDSGTMEVTPIAFDPAHKTIMNVSVGMDIKTVGGWQLSADFERRWAAKYSRDAFKLELGRCF